jgi:long-chain acyl-CoA synthetase
VTPGRPATLKALFEASFARHGARPAFTSMDVTLDYAQVERLSSAFGAFLRRGLGLAPGERVAVILPNLLQYPVAVMGALRAGLVLVTVNPLYTPREVRFQLADSGASAVLVLENFAATLEQALAGTSVRHIVTTQVGDLFPPAKRLATNFAVKRVKRMVPPWRLPGAIALPDALARGLALPDTTVRAEDMALLQYTGGTTGRAKGAVLTHGNLAANVAQTLKWLAGTLKEGEETVVTALPLFHIFALTANLLLFVKLGGRNVLIPNARDLRDLLRTLARERFTAITGVDTLYNALLDQPRFAQLDFSRLKLAIAGGMALQRPVAERWQRATGVPLVEGYGLTEASPIVSANPVDAREFTGTLGRPLEGTEVSLRDERGTQVGQDEVGEICVRGPQVTRGYWNAPEETAQAFFPNGWLRTGDLGRRTVGGEIRFVERRKDVIVVSGFKAYPTEIEAVAREHPGVADAGAIGVPHPRTGEAVVLYVVKRDPALTAEALMAHCAQHLAPYKRPARIEFRDTLPKSPIGKILHRALRDEAVPQAGL